MPDLRVLPPSLLVGFALAIALILSIPAQAQVMPGAPPTVETDSEPADPSPNDIRELMRLLSDPAMVGWLQEQGRAADADAAAGAAESVQQEFARRVGVIQNRLAALAVSWSNLPAVPGRLAEVWRKQMSADQSLRTITYVLIFLVVGSGLEWLYRQYTRPLVLRLELRHARSLMQRFQSAALRAVLILVGLLIFSAGTIGTFLSFNWPSFVENIVLNLLTIVITIRIAATVSLFFLAPRVAELRLVPLPNTLARPVHGWVVTLAALLIIAVSVTDIFDHLSGGTDASGATLAVAVTAGSLCATVIVLAIWHLTGLIREQRRERTEMPGGTRRFWPGYLTLLTGIGWVLWLLNATELMWTVVLVGLLFPLTRLCNGCVDYFFDQAQHPEAAGAEVLDLQADATASDSSALTETAGQAEDDITGGAEDQTAESDGEDAEAVSSLELYRPVARRFVRFVIVLGTVFALLAVWGGNVFRLAESETVTGRLAGVLADIILVLLIADLIWVWAKSAIDRRLANYVPPQGSEAPGPEARMATLLPILRMTLMVTLVAVVGMTILSSLGVNVGPLLAGAGIVGIAVGFGAQALVKDIVSGIFFLIDDAFRVGEYIEIGSLRGTVESMSIRSLRVRHHLGAIHTIPFGELSALTNYSRDWVIMRLEFRVPFDTDVKLVKKIVKKIGAELQENEAYGADIIQTLKSQGVRRMEEFNMVIGVKFMAKPGAQWLIRRDAYQKLRDAFEANGINFATRNVKVEVLGDQPLGEEAQKAIAGAAQQAVEAAAGPAQPVPDEP